jgi:hypothetical protein
MNCTCPASTTLGHFRDDYYRCLGRRADALFELTDALLTAGPLPSPVHLSREPVYRRGWGSFYAALRHGAIDAAALGTLLARHPLAGGQPIYAVDCSVWPRCDAEASPERGYYYHPSRHSAGQPIVAGWAYQWLTQLGFERNSWTAPLDVRRVHPVENANALAVDQIAGVLARLPSEGPQPLFVFDVGYAPTQLQQGLGDRRAALLVRLRSGRCFYGDPPAPKWTGRPPRHGRKFACADPATWPEPTTEHACEDAQYGHVRVRAWAGLHPKQQTRTGGGTRKMQPIVRGTVVLVEVSRLPRQTRKPQVLWLWWHGTGTPDLDVLWRAYVRRFDLEHTLRFLKQSLGWTSLRPRYPAQADCWTWLVLVAYTQLRLARGIGVDRRLPWERPMPATQLTPGRVRRAVSALVPFLATPANPPKPCGRSPGRPKGRRSGPAPRFPALKKAV